MAEYRTPIEVVDAMIQETVKLSTKVIDNDASYEALMTQPTRPGILGDNPHNYSIRATLNSAIGQRLQLLQEVKDAITYEECQRLEDALTRKKTYGTLPA